MGGLDYFDLLAVGAVAIAGHHQAGNFALPFLLDHLGHGCSGLAGTNYDDTARAVGGEVVGQDLTGVGGSDGSGEEIA